MRPGRLTLAGRRPAPPAPPESLPSRQRATSSTKPIWPSPTIKRSCHGRGQPQVEPPGGDEVAAHDGQQRPGRSHPVSAARRGGRSGVAEQPDVRHGTNSSARKGLASQASSTAERRHQPRAQAAATSAGSSGAGASPGSRSSRSDHGRQQRHGDDLPSADPEAVRVEGKVGLATIPDEGEQVEHQQGGEQRQRPGGGPGERRARPCPTPRARRSASSEASACGKQQRQRQQRQRPAWDQVAARFT